MKHLELEEGTENKKKWKKMDRVTREYRKQQFEKVETEYSEYKPKLKVIKPNGETNWLDITEQELQQLIEVLTDETERTATGAERVKCPSCSMPTIANTQSDLSTEEMLCEACYAKELP